MKKTFFSFLIMAGCLFQALATDIWISPDGNDQASGTAQAPKATLQAALRQARELRRLSCLAQLGRLDSTQNPGIPADLGQNITIWLTDGCWMLDEPLLLRPEDSGTEDCPTLVRAARGARPVLSGGRAVEGWQRLDKAKTGVPSWLQVPAKEVWTAPLPREAGRLPEFRQLYVNGVKALNACDVEDDDHLNKILAVDKVNRTITIPAPTFAAFSEGDRPELFLHQMWETALLRIKHMEISGDVAVLSFEAPESRLEFEHPWPPAVISDKGNSPFRLCGIGALLDHPGEWVADYAAGRLYYLPRPGEDMGSAQVTVPFLETLVAVEGSLDSPVHHLEFQGITFSYSNWTRPSRMGYVPLQAGMFLLDAYKLPVEGTPAKTNLENQAWIGRQPAAVQLTGTHHIAFTECRFEHLGATGLDFREASCQDRVEGCLFHDIAGSGLMAGKFSDPGIETHLAYRPADEREICRQMIIRNNLVCHCAREYWGCVGIIAGYVQDFLIEHNEVGQLPYSGISVGWGWIREDNCMKNNRIVRNEVHHFGMHNYSCGGIYTLSAQRGTIIAGNYIHDIYHPDYVHDTTQGHYIYLDEASSWMTIRDNWCTEAHFGQNQPGENVWGQNGPEVPASVCEQAGLEADWKQNFQAINR